MAITNDLVEKALLRNKKALVFHNEWARLPELDIIAYFRTSFITLSVH